MDVFLDFWHVFWNLRREWLVDFISAASNNVKDEWSRASSEAAWFAAKLWAIV